MALQAQFTFMDCDDNEGLLYIDLVIDFTLFAECLTVLAQPTWLIDLSMIQLAAALALRAPVWQMMIVLAGFRVHLRRFPESDHMSLCVVYPFSRRRSLAKCHFHLNSPRARILAFHVFTAFLLAPAQSFSMRSLRKEWSEVRLTTIPAGTRFFITSFVRVTHELKKFQSYSRHRELVAQSDKNHLGI